LVLQRVLETAELAALGVTATEDALETVISRLSSQAGARFNRTPVEKLGQYWSMTRNMIKPYPAQINTQAAIEATLRLYRNGVRAGDARKLTLLGHRNISGGVQGSAQAFAPASREGADHSTPYVMAMALLRGRLTPAEFERSPWESSEVKTVMAKVELVIDPEMERALDNEGILGVRLVAELNDGRTEEVMVRQPKGHPDAPLSDAELLEKMGWLLQAALRAVTPQRLLDLCNRLSTVEDVEELVDSCNIER
jgi:2-methylcitrate dehydratase